jgi:cobalamin synthase
METERPRLRRGEILAGAGGLALLIVLFALDWLRSGGVSRDGWSAVPVLRWVIVVAALSALALTTAQATARGPALPVSLSVIATVVSALTALLLIIRILTTGDTPQLGAYLGLLAAVIMSYGAFVSLRAEQGWRPDPDHPIETVPLTRPLER